MRSESGKGDEPRNVGPKFQKNFPGIEWGVSNHAIRCQRKSTKRIYTYGKVHYQEIEFPEPERPWPDPTPEMRTRPEFEAVWQCIKGWDIGVPGAYGGYCGATGNHVRAILDALNAARCLAPRELTSCMKEQK